MTLTNFRIRVAKRHLLFIGLALICTCSTSIVAQNDTFTPLGLKGGKPAGAYGLSDIDNINLFNGVVNVRLPLFPWQGRGDAKSSMSYTWDSPMRWQVSKWEYEGNPMYGVGEAGNRPDGTVGYGSHSGEISVYPQGVGSGGPNWCMEGLYVWTTTLTRFFWVDADGTEHEMRDALTGGQPLNTGGCWSVGPNRGRVFVSTDGSGATFIADQPVRDGIYAYNEFPVGYDWDGWLLFKDGRRVRISYANDRGFRDRNGNVLSTIPNQPVKDSLNRTTGSGTGTSAECNALLAGSIGCSYTSYKGFGGAERRIWFTVNQDYRTSGIFLPNGKGYRLYHNTYGDLTRIDLPTGGSIEYEYGPGLTGPQPPTFPWGPDGVYSGGPNDFHVYRRVTERRLYREGHVLESRQTFSKPEDVYLNNLGYVDKQEYDGNGVLRGTERHYFHGSAERSFWLWPTQYSPWADGKEYRVEFYDGNGVLLRKVEHTWEQRAPVSWWTGNPADAPPNDPRISQTTTYLENGMSSTKSFSYDPTVPYNSLTDVYERDYNGTVLRRTQTTYLKVLNSVDYTGSNIQNATSPHLRDFPLQVSIYDGAGIERARTTYEYDNYNSVANHAPLVSRAGISGFDSTFSPFHTTRANVTAATNYLLSNGVVTGSVTTYAQYDVAGNVVKTIDPRGYETNFYYADCFGGPNGEARSNTSPVELSSQGQSSYAFISSATNAAGHTAYAQTEFYVGQSVEREDANGVISSGYFNDPLDRPTQVIQAVNGGTTVKSQTSFSYDDSGRIVTVEADQTTFNDKVIKSQTIYDGLGRVVETRAYETGANYIAVKQIPFVMLQDGTTWLTASQESNPFRPYLGEQPVWTSSFSDYLGRTIKVKSPDNATVSTTFSGNAVTVTDAAGKQRKSVTDPLGRVVQVYEGPNSPGYNHVTTYSYDVSDNLIAISQGSQQRFFMYDSLSRLIRARNPEQDLNGTLALSDPVTGNAQWSSSFQYDNNGNVTQKIDSGGVTTTYAYDALNRNTSIDYSDGTPDVYRQYDLAVNGKGRLNQSWQAGSTIAATYIDEYDPMGRPRIQRQRFQTNGAWSDSYQVTRSYNLAGDVASQTYPSTRLVSYTYDGAGRTASFTGNLGDSVNRTYATSISYSPFGGLSKEQFGTNTALYHKQKYNIRGQLYSMALSTVNDDANWNRGSIVNYYSFQPYGFGTSGPDNNGNLLVQQHWVPNDDAISSYSFMQQNYDYDPLNRLSWVGEYQNGATATGSQNFTYDQYGNRTISSASGVGINNKQFTVNTANNRLGVPGGQSGTINYDASGNVTADTYSGGGISRAYDAENRMTSETQTGGVVGVYSYNANGQRVRRKVNAVETWQIYGMDGELIAEYAASGSTASPQREYGYRNGQLLVTAAPSAQISWLISDHLGTPRMIVDLTGALGNVKRHDYLPFGEELLAGTGGRTTAIGYSGDNVRQKFTGYEADVETGLNFAQARYQSTVQGRFTGTDPISGIAADPQTWNMYAYVGNSPINRIDPTGMSYFMGSGANDPFIRENAYRVDGFDMSPDGTASQLTDESMLTYSPFYSFLGSPQGGSGGSTQPEQCDPVFFDPLATFTIAGDPNHRTFTGEDLNFAARVIYAESSSSMSSLGDQVNRERDAIASVLFNRIGRTGFPDNVARTTFRGVAQAPNAFEAVTGSAFHTQKFRGSDIASGAYRSLQNARVNSRGRDYGGACNDLRGSVDAVRRLVNYGSQYHYTQFRAGTTGQGTVIGGSRFW